MPPPYRQPHFATFSGIPHQRQGAFGNVPSVWVAQRRLIGVPDQVALENTPLTRQEVRAICTDPNQHVLFGYVCAMAWGLQGSGPGAARHVQSAWDRRDVLEQHLDALRAGGLSRSAAYELFCGEGAILGLGPSYFTKLLYFFSPEPSFYIMDQWTGKAVNLLTGRWVVRMSGDAPSPLNKPGNYQAYCEEVDAIAGLIGATGEQVEERLFSQGGRNPWPWRLYLKNLWHEHAPLLRYSAAEIYQRYPHIPVHLF